jgi:hypothetical protein
MLVIIIIIIIIIIIDGTCRVKLVPCNHIMPGSAGEDGLQIY